MFFDGVQKNPWVAAWGGSVAGVVVVEGADVVDGVDMAVVEGDEDVDEVDEAAVVDVLELDELEQPTRPIDPAANTDATTTDLSARGPITNSLWRSGHLERRSSGSGSAI